MKLLTGQERAARNVAAMDKSAASWRAQRRRYGLTQDQIKAMADSQGHQCPLCERTIELVIDHCHDTGRVRGMLCRACNVRLGYIELMMREPEWMERLAVYFRSGLPAA